MNISDVLLPLDVTARHFGQNKPSTCCSTCEPRLSRTTNYIFYKGGIYIIIINIFPLDWVHFTFLDSSSASRVKLLSEDAGDDTATSLTTEQQNNDF